MLGTKTPLVVSAKNGLRTMFLYLMQDLSVQEPHSFCDDDTEDMKMRHQSE